MKVINERLELDTKGTNDLVNITDDLAKILAASKLKNGQMSVFVVGSTAALTTFEYEPGLIQDMQKLYEQIAPAHVSYYHDETWGDANGFSHVRAALQGPSITIPFENGKLILGTWQQVVLAEFDNRGRHRQVVVQLIGE
jgi:secondary thiamine-phosphate synthase enzyme